MLFKHGNTCESKLSPCEAQGAQRLGVHNGSVTGLAAGFLALLPAPLPFAALRNLALLDELLLALFGLLVLRGAHFLQCVMPESQRSVVTAPHETRAGWCL